jgi:hypothetical protein
MDTAISNVLAKPMSDRASFTRDIEAYRKLAADERRKAADAKLINRRALHENSAEVWEAMARSSEDLEEKSVTNKAAEAANPYPQGRRHLNLIDPPSATRKRCR